MKDFDRYKEDLAKLISFESVEGKHTSEAPFGENVKKSLDYFLRRAEEMGFQTKNYENYIGEVTYGNGEEIGVMGHLDVVPVDQNWDTPPFTLTEKDGYLYGRGVHDDIGPLLACLYALKEFKDMGIPCNRKIRLFVGCNEETDWRDVEYFNTHYGFPEYGFSPDGNFPVSYAEKGVLQSTFTIDKLKNFYDIKGGTVVNAVCSYAEVKAKEGYINKDLIKKYNLFVNGNTISSKGISAHGSEPQLGKNAILPLLHYLADMGENVQNVIDCLFDDKFNIFGIETQQGNVTLSPDIITEEKDKIKIICDCRFPAPLVKSDVTGVYDKFDIDYFVEEHHSPMMVEKEGWFVSELLSAYNKFNDEKGQPISLGGSTYARAFRKGCAFGPAFPGEQNRIHNSNENVSVENVKKFFNIYLQAFINLAKI